MSDPLQKNTCIHKQAAAEQLVEELRGNSTHPLWIKYICNQKKIKSLLSCSSNLLLMVEWAGKVFFTLLLDPGEFCDSARKADQKLWIQPEGVGYKQLKDRRLLLTLFCHALSKRSYYNKIPLFIPTKPDSASK